MINEYCIISVDDTRDANKNRIRDLMSWPEAKVDFVDGRIPEVLRSAKQKWHSVSTPGPYKAGEFGIFYSVLNCLEYGADNSGILYFEDDAIPVDDFEKRMEIYVDRLPNDADVFAVWSPHNQKGDYRNIREFDSGGVPKYGRKSTPVSIFEYGDPELSRLWQGYGNVAMAFTKRGCEKTLEYVHEKGFFSPIDCLICIGSHTGRLNGYALKPQAASLVNYNWNRPTTIHQSKWDYIEKLMEEK